MKNKLFCLFCFLKTEISISVSLPRDRMILLIRFNNPFVFKPVNHFETEKNANRETIYQVKKLLNAHQISFAILATAARKWIKQLNQN